MSVNDKQVGEFVAPDPLRSHAAPGTTSTRIFSDEPTVDTSLDAATVLLANLFAGGDRDIPGISYAVGYRLAELHSGGDIVDVYRFDNDAVALSIADISGKGTQAAVHAALIKYGLRAYASHGLTPEKTMRAMDRLYLENSTFEHIESFASVFLGIVDVRRRILTYSSAGHEPVVLLHPHLTPQILKPTCPIIGVFDDQHHLFRQESVDLWPGSLLIAVTDGVTEARSPSRRFFGTDRFVDCVLRHRDRDPSAIIDALLAELGAFTEGIWHDDVAILVARFA